MKVHNAKWIENPIHSCIPPQQYSLAGSQIQFDVTSITKNIMYWDWDKSLLQKEKKKVYSNKLNTIKEVNREEAEQGKGLLARQMGTIANTHFCFALFSFWALRKFQQAQQPMYLWLSTRTVIKVQTDKTIASCLFKVILLALFLLPPPPKYLPCLQSYLKSSHTAFHVYLQLFQTNCSKGVLLCQLLSFE